MSYRKAVKRRGRPFVPGRSGNPAGRPKNEERRRKFIAAYIANIYRGSKAAIAAGCPPKGARVAAMRMLREPDVRSQIDEHLRARSEEFERWQERHLAGIKAQALRYLRRR
jgi:hypothetical protein